MCILIFNKKMIEREKERKSIEQAQKDFEQLRKKPKYTLADQEQLAYDVADLTGWYRVDQNPELAALIERMLSFGEKKLWSMAGARIEFERTKQKQKKS